MQDYGIDAIVGVLRKEPILHDLLIDKLSREYGLSALKDLELFIMAEKENWKGKDTIEKYLEDKIALIEADEKRKRDKEIIDLDNAQKLNKKLKNEWWRNPVIAVASLAVGIIGTLTTQYLSPRLIPKDKSENIYEETVKMIIRSIQKDNVKKK
jgi:hypothetical protein